MGLWDFIESFPKKWYKFVDVFIEVSYGNK